MRAPQPGLLFPHVDPALLGLGSASVGVGTASPEGVAAAQALLDADMFVLRCRESIADGGTWALSEFLAGDDRTGGGSQFDLTVPDDHGAPLSAWCSGWGFGLHVVMPCLVALGIPQPHSHTHSLTHASPPPPPLSTLSLAPLTSPSPPWTPLPPPPHTHALAALQETVDYMFLPERLGGS